MRPKVPLEFANFMKVILLLCIAPTYGFGKSPSKSEKDLPYINNKKSIKAIETSTSYFIQNNGQLINEFSEVNAEVLYFISSKNYHIYIYEDGFGFELFKQEKSNSLSGNSIQSRRVKFQFPKHPKIPSISAHLFSDVNVTYYAESYNKPEKKLSCCYDRIVCQNILPNVDIEYLIVQGKFKYNLILHPGYSKELLNFTIQGSSSNILNENGTLSIYTSLGYIEDFIPLAFQKTEKQEEMKLPIKFEKIDQNTFGFNIPHHEAENTIVIDPAPMITFFGGENNDELFDIQSDALGNIYVAGNTNSQNNIATSGAYQNTLNGSNDIYVAKFTALGQLVWATYFGGSNNETYGKLCLDKQKNVYVTGGTNSSNGIATTGAYQTTYGGGTDIFLVKLDSNGTRKWATYLGGNAQQYAVDIAISPLEEIYITGRGSTGDSVLTSIGAVNRFGAGSTDAFVVKFNTQGIRLWGSYFGGEYFDEGRAILALNSGDIVLAGSTLSTTGIASPGAFQTTKNNDYDCFFVWLKPNGNISWSSYFGGDSLDDIQDITSDSYGNVIGVGYTLSKSGLVEINAYQNKLNGIVDAMLIKFDSTGRKHWSTYYGYEGVDIGKSIQTDSYGNLIIAGTSNSQDSMVTTNAYQTIYGGGGLDIFFAKFSPSFNRNWASYLGGDGVDYINTFQVIDQNNILLAGRSNSINGLTTIGSFQVNTNGNYDGFWGRLSIPASNQPILNNTLSKNQSICIGNKPDTIFGSTPYGGNGNFSYQWISSESNAAGTFLPTINGNQRHFLPSQSNKKIFYKRIVISDGLMDTSLATKIETLNSLNIGFTINQQIQCINDNQFIFTDTTQGATSRIWDFGNGDTSTFKVVSRTYTPSIDNSHSVSLTSFSDTNCYQSITKNIYVINNPNTGQIMGDTVVVKNFSKSYSVKNNPGSTYEWIFKKGSGKSKTNVISIQWINEGIDTLKVVEKAGNNCLGDTVFLNIKIMKTNSMVDQETQSLQLSPNPNEGAFWIKVSYPLKGQYAIINSTGILVQEGNLTQEENLPYLFDVKQLPSGLYYLRIIAEQPTAILSCSFMKN